MNLESTNKNFFTNNLNVGIFVFTTTIISAKATIIILYLLCKHNKLRTLVASLALQQVKEVGTSAMKHDINIASNCTPQFYIILALSASIFRLVLFTILQTRRIKLWRGQLFSNAVKIVLFYMRHTILCTNKIMENHRKQSSIQNYRNIDTR